jgi:molybdopterin converting factor small subunit
MVTVRIPWSLQVHTGGRDVVEGEGRNVRQLILDLDARYPGIKAGLLDGEKLKPHVKVVVDGQIALLGLLAPLAEGMEILFIPAISGG